MSFENLEPTDADKFDQYFKLIASRTGREIANYVASNVFIKTIEFDWTLEHAEEGIKAAIDNMEELIAPYLQENEIVAQSFERERNIFIRTFARRSGSCKLET